MSNVSCNVRLSSYGLMCVVYVVWYVVVVVVVVVASSCNSGEIANGGIIYTVKDGQDVGRRRSTI